MGSGDSKYDVSKHHGTQDREEYVEQVVFPSSEIKENEMKPVEVAGTKVLVIKQKGELFAIGNKCSHYGAPLSTGVLGDGHVRCPWHGACFNIRTGDIEEFPGVDSVPCYEVYCNSYKDVVVKAKRSLLKDDKRVKKMEPRDPKNEEVFVVIGAGAAGLSCVETLRQEGYKGRLILITSENKRPYDRTKLSKLLDADIDKLAFRTDDFYHKHGIEIMTSTEVTGLDAQHSVLRIGSKKLGYTSLFIATGTVPRRPSIGGNNLANTFVLRTVDDANAIAKVVDNEKDVVILGASFIGMEVAAYCVKKARSVTVVMRDEVPFKASLGVAVGERLKKLSEENGVKFLPNEGLAELRPGPDGKHVHIATTTEGKELPANIVIFGIGTAPNTEFLHGSGVDVTAAGTIPVDEKLHTGALNVYAGGDVALAPVMGGEKAAIGHWQLAQHHGAHAARNMLGADKPLKTIPFFWTMLYGKGLRYAGYAPNFEEVVITGDLEALKFAAYYIKGSKALAVATMGRDPLVAKIAERWAAGDTLTREQAACDEWAS